MKRKSFTFRVVALAVLIGLASGVNAQETGGGSEAAKFLYGEVVYDESDAITGVRTEERTVPDDVIVVTGEVANYSFVDDDGWYYCKNAKFTGLVTLAANVHIINGGGNVFDVSLETMSDDNGPNGFDLSIYDESGVDDAIVFNDHIIVNHFYVFGSAVVKDNTYNYDYVMAKSDIVVAGSIVVGDDNTTNNRENLYAQKDVFICGTANVQNRIEAYANITTSGTVTCGSLVGHGNGFFNITGGIVFARTINSNNCDVTISGGQVTSNFITILTHKSLILGYTNDTDFIICNSYTASRVYVAEGCRFAVFSKDNSGDYQFDSFIYNSDFTVDVFILNGTMLKACAQYVAVPDDVSVKFGNTAATADWSESDGSNNVTNYYIYHGEANGTVNLEYTGDDIPDGCSIGWENGDGYVIGFDSFEDFVDSETGALVNTDGALAHFTMPSTGDFEVNCSTNSFPMPGAYCGSYDVNYGTNVAWYVADKADATTGATVPTFTLATLPTLSEGEPDFTYFFHINDIELLKGLDVTKIVVDDGINYVYSLAFLDWDTITEAVIGKDVTEIWDAAFATCDNLKSVTFTSSDIHLIDNTAFNNDGNFFYVFVPDATAIDDYIYAFGDKADDLTFIPTTVTFDGTSGWATYCHDWPVAYAVSDGLASNAAHAFIANDIVQDDAGNYAIQLALATNERYESLTSDVDISIKNPVTGDPYTDVVAPYTPVILSYGIDSEDNPGTVVLTAIPATATALPAKSPGRWGGYDLVAFPIASDTPGATVGEYGIFFGTPAYDISSSVYNTIYSIGDDDTYQSYALYGTSFARVGTDNGMPAHRCWLNVDKRLFTNAVGSARIYLSQPDATDDATAIADTAFDRPAADGWTTLDGRRLSRRPDKPGIYVCNGKKLAVHQ